MVAVLTLVPILSRRGLWDQIGHREMVPVAVAWFGYAPWPRLLPYGASPTLPAILGATKRVRAMLR